MRILFLTNEFPLPKEKNGSTLINFYLLASLATFAEVDFVSFMYEDNSLSERDFSPSITFHLIKKKKAYSKIAIIRDTVLMRPYECAQYYDSLYQEKVLELLDTNKYDLIFSDLLFFFQYVASVKNIVKIVSPHDSFSLLTLRLFKQEKNIFKKLYLHRRYSILKNYEISVFRKNDFVFFVSSVDLEHVGLRILKDKSCVIPNGVDLDYFYPRKEIKKDISVSFVGNFSYKPNIEAVLFFFSQVYPILKTNISKLTVCLIGGNVPDAISQYRSKDIMITGFVPDIREYLWRTKVFISPLLSGSGIKNKMLEAMALGIPIVATPLSFDGIENSNNLFRMETLPCDMANSIIELINNPSLADTIAESSYRLVKEKYSWDIVQALYKSKILDILHKHESNKTF